jgi:peptidoglycan/LPS O-acetylase OafA/YrhL
MVIAYGDQPKINFLEYLKNRLARVYPVYLLAMLLMFVSLVLTKAEDKYDGILLNLFMVQAWVPGKALSFNGAGWSLSVEMLFYLLFPLLFNYIYKRLSTSTLVFPIAIFWLLTQVLLHWVLYSKYYHGFPSKSHDFIFYSPLMHLNEFLIGNLAGLVFMKKWSGLKKHFDVFILMVIALILVAFEHPMGMTYHNGILVLLFVPLILLMSTNKGLITFVFKMKLFVFLGEISFGIYILQVPVFTLSGEAIKYFKLEAFVNQFYISLLVLIVMATLSYLLIETPLRNRIKRIRVSKDSPV